MKRILIKLFRPEDGISAIFVALTLSGLLAISSLTIDMGLAYIDASEIQNVADAVALSVGQYLPVGEDDQTKKAIIVGKAIEYAQKNGYEALTADNISFSGLGSGKYKSLTVTVSKTSATYLAKIVGVNDITTEKTATISAVPAGSITGGVPVGITADAYHNAISAGQTEHIIFKSGGGSGENGFFGFVVLDGSNGNAAAMANAMKYGYQGEVCINDTVPLATGNMASAVKQAVDYRMSLCHHYPESGGCTVDHFIEGCPRIMYLMIYEFVDSRTVKLTGFAGIILERSQNSDEIQGSLISINVSYTTYTSDSDCGLYTYRLIG